MDRTRVYDILNELLAAEGASLLPRLTECTTFVQPSDTGGLEAVQRMAAEHQANTARLTRTLIDLGGAPQPHVRDIDSAGFHYLELEVLLPQVVACEEATASRCDAALPGLSECPPAALVARELGSWHRVCADFLRKLIPRPRAG